MPIAHSLSIGGITTPMVTAMIMDLNGNAITISEGIHTYSEQSSKELKERHNLSYLVPTVSRGNPYR